MILGSSCYSVVLLNDGGCGAVYDDYHKDNNLQQ